MTPGGADANHNEPNWGMLAAIITDAGPYYFKLVGPHETLATQEEAFAAMIDSIKKTAN